MYLEITLGKRIFESDQIICGQESNLVDSRNNPWDPRAGQLPEFTLQGSHKGATALAGCSISPFTTFPNSHSIVISAQNNLLLRFGTIQL